LFGPSITLLLAGRVASLSLEKLPSARQEQSCHQRELPLQFQKRGQLFIRTDNETLSAAAVCALAIEIVREDSLHSAIGGGAFSQLLPSAVLFNS